MGIFEPCIFSSFPLLRKSFPLPFPFPWKCAFHSHSHGNPIPTGNPIPMHTSKSQLNVAYCLIEGLIWQLLGIMVQFFVSLRHCVVIEKWTEL